MAFDFKFPDVGEGIHEGKIVKWLIKEGDGVKADQSIAEIETDKAVVEIPSPHTGKIIKLYHVEGETIKVGEPLVTFEGTAPSFSTAATEQGVVGSLEKTATGVMKAPTAITPDATSASPFAGVAVFENGTALANQPVATSPAPVATPVPAPNPTTQPVIQAGIGVTKAGLKAVKKYDLFGYIDHVKYEGIRKVIGDRMAASVSAAPHVTHMDFADVTKLWKIREKEKIKAEKDGIKLTFMPFFIKAVIAGLKKHPYLNSSLDETIPEIVLKKYFNIGLAVDTEAGLFVPVIKGADQKSILQLAKEIADLAQKARDKKLNAMDMKGGTFTITNIGSVGGGFLATPIINFPEAAILGTGMIQDAPVARNGKVVIRKMMGLSLTFDHRILDGAEAARFVNTVKEHLEDPDLMLVEGK